MLLNGNKLIKYIALKFFQKQNTFWLGDKLSPVFKHGILRSEEYIKFYGLSKVHKDGMPLRPIVSRIGAVTYETLKELAKILKPLVRRAPGKNIYDSEPYYLSTGVLLEEYLLHIPG